MSSIRIDVHHHVVTPAYVEELAKVGVFEAGGGPFPNWKPEDSLVVMDRNTINTALLSVSSPGLSFGDDGKARDMARVLNEFSAQTVTRWPERFGFFAVLPLPNVENALAEISYALDTLHADGIGLLSNTAGIYLGDPRFDPIFAELDRHAAVVFMHPTVFTGSEIPSAKNAGSPIPTMPGFMLEFIFDTTRAVTNLVMSGTIKKYPHIRFIISHAGGTVPFVAHKIAIGGMIAQMQRRGMEVSTDPKNSKLSPEEMQSFANAQQEDAFNQLRSLYYDTALTANANVFSSLQQLVPASHILLGTDYPFAPASEPTSTLQGINAYSGFSEQDRQDIEGNNALQLFPRLQNLR
jgi:6-methylsalicylate decarboxylase